MDYISTRGKAAPVSASEAIVQGLANDGGLFVPTSFPQWDLTRIESLCSMPYHAVASAVLAEYLTDFSTDEIDEMTQKAYGSQFDDQRILPIHTVDKFENILEIYHGPTIAFKDIALQILPHLMTKSMQKTGETKKILILVATSGDTGKAALEGFHDVENTSIIVFYPADGVSDAQKLQMTTQEGNNVYVCAVEGNFDDTQTGVKRIFSDPVMAETLANDGFRLSSANSINWGRLLPQIVYYFWSYAQLINSKQISLGDSVNFVVPTGNFGNILAGYYAKRMGLPIGKLICASNQNNVLTDFFNKGEYDRNREFYQTSSPSMDILISSNLERLLFELANRDGAQVAQWMDSLQTDGKYSLTKEQHLAIQDVFYSAWCDDEVGAFMIRHMFEDHDYLIDTHTATAQSAYEIYSDQTDDASMAMILSTANPYKFSFDVLDALKDSDVGLDGKDTFELCNELSRYTKTKIPEAILALQDKAVLFSDVCPADKMEQCVLSQVKKWK